MKLGMLWFDDDPKRDLPAKVQRAAEYYRGKYGRGPTVCQIHPSAGTVLERVEGIALVANVLVLPGHLWLGTEEA